MSPRQWPGITTPNWCIYSDTPRFPEYDVNPNTGEPLGRHAHVEVAHQRIYHAASMGSHVVLPLQPTDHRQLAKDTT